MKRHKTKTAEKQRTPLGDKGLGRLGVQKLGMNVEIFTTPKNGTVEHHVGWSWTDFEGESTLAQIKPKYQPCIPTRKRGTKLIISGIADADHWKSKDNVDDFERKLSELISPYRNFSEFTITASVNGHTIQLAEITERVRRLAQSKSQSEFDDSRS